VGIADEVADGDAATAAGVALVAKKMLLVNEKRHE
jgi:hypothetical protein